MKPYFHKLLEYKRNSLSEQEHSGIVLLMNKKGIIKEVGKTNNYKFYQRSCMKPLQLAEFIDLGLHKKYAFTLDEIAVMCASHIGDLEHQRAVLSILKKIGVDKSYLLCAKENPLSSKEQQRLIKNALDCESVHNNCSGKHSAMLAICLEKGWSLNNYMDDSHPLTNLVIGKVLQLCDITSDDYIKSKDGCGLTTIATEFENIGFGYFNLFLNPEYELIKQAFLEYPYMIGGEGRLDSEIMAASNKKLIAKVGAGGIITVINLKKEEVLLVKIADANMKARGIVTIEALRQLKWLNENQIYSSNLSDLFNKDIATLGGEIIGKIEITFSLI